MRNRPLQPLKVLREPHLVRNLYVERSHLCGKTLRVITQIPHCQHQMQKERLNCSYLFLAYHTLRIHWYFDQHMQVSSLPEKFWPFLLPRHTLNVCLVVQGILSRPPAVLSTLKRSECSFLWTKTGVLCDWTLISVCYHCVFHIPHHIEYRAIYRLNRPESELSVQYMISVRYNLQILVSKL